MQGRGHLCILNCAIKSESIVDMYGYCIWSCTILCLDLNIRTLCPPREKEKPVHHRGARDFLLTHLWDPPIFGEDTASDSVTFMQVTGFCVVAEELGMTV